MTISGALTKNGDIVESPTGTYAILSTNSFSNYVTTSSVQNFTENDTLLEVVSLDTRTSAELNLQIRDPASSTNEASIKIVADGTVRYRQDNAQLGSATYDATAMKWLRIGHRGSDTVWWTSPDGATWTERFRAAATFLVNGSHMRIFAYCPTSSTTARATVRNVNTVVPTSNATLTADAATYQPGDTITLTAGGGTTTALTQTDGATAAGLTHAGGGIWTAEAPWTLMGDSLTFSHTVSGDASPATITVSVEPAQQWMVDGSGVWVPVSEELIV